MFRKWFKPSAPDDDAHFDPIAPEQPVVAVGDIHGCYDLLRRLPRPGEGGVMICVGDLIDRGDQSADVLRYLHDTPDIVTLMGNHEEMLLGFLKAPQEKGARWLRFGGLQTLASFGVTGVAETTTGDGLLRAHDALVKAMGDDLITWIKALPTLWQSGNMAVVHAGADPAKPLDAQDQSTLLWGHKDFGIVPRTDGMWIVHGHTIVPQPSEKRGVVAIDTGAYATGNLTAAKIHDGLIEFGYA